MYQVACSVTWVSRNRALRCINQMPFSLLVQQASHWLIPLCEPTRNLVNSLEQSKYYNVGVTLSQVVIVVTAWDFRLGSRDQGVLVYGCGCMVLVFGGTYLLKEAKVSSLVRLINKQADQILSQEGLNT